MSLGVRLAAACLLAAAAGVVPISSASAATCSSADGVSVVVDFHELGGGVQSACVADGGGSSAAALFDAAGFSIDRVQRQQGFVCRISGKPASDPCVNTPPADAYWGLWWSDGTSGQWTYATRGVDSQTVPDGGYVAFSWNGSTSRSAPGASPAVHPTTPTASATPTRTPQPATSPKPTKNPARPTPSVAGQTTAASPSASAGSSDSASATASPSGAETTPSGAAGKPTKSPGGVDGEMLPPDESQTDAPAPEASSQASEPADASDGGLPTWVGPVVVVLLFAAGGAVAVVRRRGKPAP